MYDVNILAASTDEKDVSDRTFIWIARPCGTNLFLAKETLMKDTEAYIRCQYFAQHGVENLKAYLIVVDGLSNDKIMGTCSPIDFVEYAKQSAKEARDVVSQIITFADKTVEEFKFPEKHNVLWDKICVHGEIIKRCYVLQ